MNAVEFQGVSKSYAIYDAPGDRFKELLSLNRLKRHRDFWALHEASFEVQRGETFCIVGENGSGKSTMLQMVAGILQPTLGTVAVNGRVSALLELGAGFNPEFSARTNIEINGMLIGLTRRQVAERFEAILEFAGLERFVDQQLKNYSSGMLLRLAYSVAIQVPFDILLVDEALAVGDAEFQQKCLETFEQMRAEGKTVVLVSHDLGAIDSLCDRALLLRHGTIEAIGEPAKVIDYYEAHAAVAV